MTEAYDKELLNSFADVAEELGWDSDWKIENGSVEIQTWSDAGEQVIMTLFTNDFQDYRHLVKRLMDEYFDFDPEEHAAMWYGQGRGEPSSLRVLLDDADGIAKKLDDLAMACTQRLRAFWDKEKEQGRLM